MIRDEEVGQPSTFSFDVAVAAVGYERRCRYVVGEFDVTAERAIGLEFGFLEQASYSDNRQFFDKRGWQALSVQDSRTCLLYTSPSPRD